MKLTRSTSQPSSKPIGVVPVGARIGMAGTCMVALIALAACGGGGSDPASTQEGTPAAASTDAAMAQPAGADVVSDATPVATNASDVAPRANAAAAVTPAAADITPAASNPATKPVQTPTATPSAAAPAPVAAAPATPAPAAPAPAGATVDAPAAAPVPVAAAPVAAASSAPQTEAMLAMINLKRGATQKCGETFYAPARPLLANLAAETAATQHSAWMQQNLSLSHTGAGGTDPGARLQAAGFAWGAVAENVAAGYENAQQTVDAWMASAPHCANIMRGDFSIVGFSMVPPNGSTVAYATLVLAKGK